LHFVKNLLLVSLLVNC